MASPFLMVPLTEENNPEINHLCLHSLKDKKPYILNILQNLKDFQCVGSSHGWLAFLDKDSNPFLLNPFSRTRIYLPSKHALRSDSPFSPSRIKKLVFSVKNSAVVAIYSYGYDRTSLAFCRLGDEEWSDLDCKGETHYDVVCCDQTSTLFVVGLGPSVESWDLNQTIPKKKMMINDSFQRILERLGCKYYESDHLYTSQWYLALSLGQIFVVVRYIGEFVRYDGAVVHEEDTLTDDAAEPLVCPYRTVDFHVFKLDEKEKWIKVDSLDGFAMFLGGNQSMMVSSSEHSELKANAIYFTDDYWERLDEDYSYGGHDMGVFNMEDGTIEQLLHCQHGKFEPPPFWITLPYHH